ncbi:acyltransferase family protein [Nonomuraea sp. NPDC050536]|uniref:acyltransferase family protein n=1 Tax=Nonomuraea sp. NPDC050536 TaxID=3364366 RepID=UPI0037C63112
MKTETRAPAATRLHAVDNLRIVLTVLVVLHHAAVTYGNIPVWYYNEVPKDPSGVLLDVMVAFNQAFFMGFFFMISGFFTPGSYDRKGGRAFMRDRLVRLGIPLLVYLLVLRPLVLMPIYAKTSGLPYWQFYLGSWDPGPMWFVEVLIVFAALYVLYRRARPIELERTSVLRGRTIVLFALGLSVATWLWRFLVPTGTMIPVLGLPTPDYLPQYCAMFAVGVLAVRRGWYATLPRRAGWIGFTVTGVVTAALLPLKSVSGGMLADLVEATWESTFATAIVIGLVVLFRERFNRQGRFGAFLSGQAYTVYIIHPLVLVGVAVAMRDLQMIAVVKFAILAVIVLPVCWGLAYLVRSIPGAKKIL